MKLHILGICGTFMGSLALIARQCGHIVTGSDLGIYPPMSELLAQEGVDVRQGYDPKLIPHDVDLVIIGNALSRGNASVEHVLNERLAYTSGPAWLSSEVLKGRRVLAVGGTHGKTTTASITAWLLEAAGRKPGFLIGGVPGNFSVSARLGAGEDFVIEADEYDTAFFDKRSKFVHYQPSTLILNNLEFDHADIFPDLSAIQRQFHHVVRIVPQAGQIISNATDKALAEVLAMGCWTPVTTFGPTGAWGAQLDEPSGRAFTITNTGRSWACRWPLIGAHNVMNATAAVAAVAAHGVEHQAAVDALASFRPPRRRQELIGEPRDITILDDFAHHPTAIRATIDALRAAFPGRRVLTAFELRSNSMRMGAHGTALLEALALADRSYIVPGAGTGGGTTSSLAEPVHAHVTLTPDVETLLDGLENAARKNDVIVFMSNGAFDQAPRRFAAQLAERSS